MCIQGEKIGKITIGKRDKNEVMRFQGYLQQKTGKYITQGRAAGIAAHFVRNLLTDVQKNVRSSDAPAEVKAAINIFFDRLEKAYIRGLEKGLEKSGWPELSEIDPEEILSSLSSELEKRS